VTSSVKERDRRVSRLAESRAFVGQRLRQYFRVLTARHLQIPNRTIDLRHLVRDLTRRRVARQLVAAWRQEPVVGFVVDRRVHVVFYLPNVASTLFDRLPQTPVGCVACHKHDDGNVYYPVPDRSGDGVLFSIDFFVSFFLCFFVSKIARKRLDRFA